MQIKKQPGGDGIARRLGIEVTNTRRANLMRLRRTPALQSILAVSWRATDDLENQIKKGNL